MKAFFAGLLAVRSKLGSFDGRAHRTIEPVGGTIGTDIAGTVQGLWFNAAQPTYPETPHLAIVPDNVDPTRIGVSIGTSQPGFESGAYSFVPASSGTINRDPATIVPGATIYCWEIGYSATDRRGVVLLQLSTATTLAVEARPGGNLTCATESPLLTPGKVFSYVR